MLQILFDGFEFAFECFEFGSSGSNWYSNALNACRMVRICIRMLRPFRKGRIYSFKSLSNALNLDLDASNPF